MIPEGGDAYRIARIALRRVLSSMDEARAFDDLAERLTSALRQLAASLPDSAPR